MNINTVSALFALFIGKSDIDEYLPLISSAISEVTTRLKADIDKSDERLTYVCAGTANLRYAQMMSARERIAYTKAGSIAQNYDCDFRIKTATAMLNAFTANAKDLLIDDTFSFINT